MPISYPKVVTNDVNGFALAWDMRGIKMILDATSRQFAVDFANTVLRSYVDDLVEKAQAAQKAKQAVVLEETPAPVPAPVAPAPKKKSKIVLTD
jgi:hypothetical protein